MKVIKLGASMIATLLAAILALANGKSETPTGDSKIPEPHPEKIYHNDYPEITPERHTPSASGTAKAIIFGQCDDSENLKNEYLWLPVSYSYLSIQIYLTLIYQFKLGFRQKSPFRYYDYR